MLSVSVAHALSGSHDALPHQRTERTTPWDFIENGTHRIWYAKEIIIVRAATDDAGAVNDDLQMGRCFAE